MRGPHYTKLPIIIDTSPPLNGYADHLKSGRTSPSSSSSSSGSSLSSPTGRHSPTLVPLHRLVAVLRSAVPQILFLCIYGLNTHLHILPRFADLDRIRLYNVSAAEAALFGTPLHVRVSAAHNPLLDLLSGIPYLIHYIIPLAYPIYLWWRGQLDDVPRFYWLLGWSSWALYVIWFLLPTAPPWFYDVTASVTTTPPGQHATPPANGTALSTAASLAQVVANHVHKEGCAFRRVDAMTGVPLFRNLFRNNPVPFASFPSGHVLWPTCIFITSPPGGRLFALYVVWVSWATLYSCHHYLSDALAAVAVALIMKRLLAYVADRRPCSAPSCSCRAVVCPLTMV